MIMLIVFTFYALYFFYLYKWVQSRLLEEYNFGSPSPPKPLPHSPSASILIGILWGLIIIGGVFWGFTFNRYPSLSLDDSYWETWLLIVICIALGLSYTVIYHLGEIRGIASMKGTALFERYLSQSHSKREA